MKANVYSPCLMTVLFVILTCGMKLAAAEARPVGATIIVVDPQASPREKLARQEVRRYVYLRSGSLLPLADAAPGGKEAIVIGQKDRAAIRSLAAGSSLASDMAGLEPEQYLLRTIEQSGRRVLMIVGGGDTGALYGAYRFAETLGVRFYLHGDVIPDRQIDWALPGLNESGKPLFKVRGIQPFHDFPEGPDWWNREDYLTYVGQLAKLRMNFLGLHCYPEGGVGPEPGVWIGISSDLSEQARVQFSYPSQWASTARNGMWGYAGMKTSEFCGGADQLFAGDIYGPDVMDGAMPSPASPEQSNRVFDRAGDLFQEVFAEAKALGVKTCIGTETPLTIPKPVRERLQQQGKDPQNPAVIREVYQGLFRRIARLYPVDYYWLWTPEGWTWSGNKPEEFQATITDIQAALGALKDLNDPFTLATSGWVLGPVQDRAALDRFLPKNVPMSCINREVGHDRVDPAFGQIQNRPKWAIPWMENDPNLVSAQPYAGRMRYDAADALRYGCDGLLGIHWRTKAMAPNVAALAAASWDQSWKPENWPDEWSDKPTDALRRRSMPTLDFYEDFARAHFGETAAKPVGALLARIDGFSLPQTSTWLDGPGGIVVRPWPEKDFAFVGELESLRELARSAGDRERFDYWLNTYRLLRAHGQLATLRAKLDGLMKEVVAAADAAVKKKRANEALTIRVQLAREWERLISLQVAATDTPGELGTIANLEQHNRRFLKFLSIHDEKLAAALQQPLPAEVEPGKQYQGPARLIVPTVRSSVAKGQPLRLRAMAVDGAPVRGVELHWRPLGTGDFKAIPARCQGRAVYTVALPPVEQDVEYYLSATTASGARLTWPVTAPQTCQTVVATE